MSASGEDTRRLAFEQAAVAMVVVDADGRVVEANREAGELFDRSQPALQSLRAADLFADAPLVGETDTRMTAVPSRIRTSDNTVQFGALSIDENEPRGTVVTLRLPTIDPESAIDVARESV